MCTPQLELGSQQEPGLGDGAGPNAQACNQKGSDRGKAGPSLIGPLEMSAAGGSSLRAERQPNQGAQMCLSQEEPAEG